MEYFWVILFVILLIIEAITVNLVTIWALIGSLLALITSYITDDINIQLIVFFASTISLLILTKPFIKNVLNIKKESTNLDSVIGKEGVIIDNNGYRVKVMGKDWAYSSDEDIEVGKKVKVLQIKGVKLIVKEVDE